MPRDEIQDVPSFAASRDEAVSAAPRGAPPSARRRSGGGGDSGGGAGSGLLGRLVLTVAVVAAAISCAWAWQLQQTANRSEQAATALAQRVADLEALLSDTDESVEKSAATLSAQLSVVDKEARRLEQRRREMDVRIDQLEKSGQATAGKVAKLETDGSSRGKTLAALSDDLAALKRLAGDLERLSKTARDAQANAERLADSVNKANLERAALQKRIAANEEWIESINAFRKQVNSSISRLESQLRIAPVPGQPLQ